MNFLENVNDIPFSNGLNIGDGALYALLAISMVFAVLTVIIGITSVVSIIIKKVEAKIETKNPNADEELNKKESKNVEITDDDMMAAVLVATIDYRNEVKQDVRLINVKEIK